MEDIKDLLTMPACKKYMNFLKQISVNQILSYRDELVMSAQIARYLTVSLFIAKQQTTISAACANLWKSSSPPFSSTRSSHVPCTIDNPVNDEKLLYITPYYDKYYYILFIWQGIPLLLFKVESQLRFVARTFTPNGRKRFANWNPISPNPIINTCRWDE